MSKYLKKITNSEEAKLYRINYSKWKETALNRIGYFVIFKTFISSEKLKNISGNALKLYIYLGINSKNMTGEVWHSNAIIAKYFDKSERTIRSWMKELEDLNLIKRLQFELNGNTHTFLQPYKIDKLGEK